MPVPQPRSSHRRRRPPLHAKPRAERAFDLQLDTHSLDYPFDPKDPLSTLAPIASARTRARSRLHPRPFRPVDPGVGKRSAQQGSLRMAHSLEMPVWVRYVAWWRQTTTGVAILTCAITTGLYSWTVYTQHRWSVQYEALEQMQRNDRQFQLTQESMANSLRETATRGEMVPLVPDRMIDLPVLPLDSAVVPALEPDPEQSPSPQIPPVGY